MTDHVTSDTTQGAANMQIPADLIRDAVSAGLSAKTGAPAPDATSASAPDPVGEARPMSSAAGEPAPMAGVPPSARRRLAGIGGWAKTVPRRLHKVDVAHLRWPAAAMGMVLTAGLGFGAAHLASRNGANDPAEQRWHEAAAGLQQTHGEVSRLAGDLKSIRHALDGLKSARADLPARQTQLNEKLERATSEGAARIGKLAEQLDRIEKTQRDPNRLATLVERLDRIEKQTAGAAEKLAAAPTPPPKPVAAAPAPADVTQTGSLGDAKPAARTADKGSEKTHDRVADKPVARASEFDPRRTQLDTHILRDVDQGIALIEARNGRMIEARPGQTISGLGRVEAIERRGRGWIVVTAKGFVGERLP